MLVVEKMVKDGYIKVALRARSPDARRVGVPTSEGASGFNETLKRP